MARCQLKIEVYCCREGDCRPFNVVGDISSLLRIKDCGLDPDLDLPPVVIGGGGICEAAQTVSESTWSVDGLDPD